MQTSPVAHHSLETRVADLELTVAMLKAAHDAREKAIEEQGAAFTAMAGQSD